MSAQTSLAMAGGASTGAARANRFLCFCLGGEAYAMPLLSVLEVIAPPEITPVPQMPSYFVGVMNLRGQIISVVDLRAKMGIAPRQGTETAIIICDTQPNALGVIVDAIDSVLNPPASAISSRPTLRGAQGRDYVHGVFRHENRLVLMVDITKILTTGDQKMAAPTSKIAAN